MKFKKLSALVLFFYTSTVNIPVLAATSPIPNPTPVSVLSIPGVIKVVNNYKSNKDSITINGSYFNYNDKISIYKSALKTGQIGTTKTINQYLDDEIIVLDQLGESTGDIYVCLNSGQPVKVSYPGEITVVNNVDIADAVTFNGLKKGNTAKVYATVDAENPLGQATVSEDGDVYVTLENPLAEPVLPATTNTVYIQVNDNAKEVVTYNAAKRTNAPALLDVVVNNNKEPELDTVTVKSLEAKEIATVYAADGTTVLGKATAKTNQDVTITLTQQLSESVKKIKVTLREYNELESAQTEVQYDRSLVPVPIGYTISAEVKNNVDINDTVTFSSLKLNDTAIVYSADGKTILGTAKAVKTSVAGVTPETYGAVVSLSSQLSETESTVQVAVKSEGTLESPKQTVSYSPQAITVQPVSTKITVENNVDKADRVTVNGLTAGDEAKVYALNGEFLGKAEAVQTSAAGVTPATYGATVSLLNKLSDTDFKIEVSIKGENKLESEKTLVNYSAEEITGIPNIIIENNVDKADKVELSGLEAGARVLIYDKSGTNLLGKTISVQTSAEGVTPKTYGAVVLLKTQLSESDLEVRLAVKSENKLERVIQKSYSSEAVTSTPEVRNIIVNNNVDIADIVTVSGLMSRDKVTVFDAAGTNILGTAVAPSSGIATVTLKKQLSETDLELSLSVKSVGKKESSRVNMLYQPQAVSESLNESKITVINHVDTQDIVTVTDLKAKDKVTVYTADGKTILGSATAVTMGTLSISLKKQLNETDLEAKVSVKSSGQMESPAVSVYYEPQKISDSPIESQITVENNVDISDKVYVTGLKAKDKITVYSADGKTVLGTATISSGTAAIVSLKKQLSEIDLEVLVAVKSYDKLESYQVSKIYGVQTVTQTDTIYAYVTNNVDKADVVRFYNVASKDKVTVYSADGKNILGTATVTGIYVEVALKKQLNEMDSEVYVSVKKYNTVPSELVSIQYLPQLITNTISPLNVIVTNNVDKADTVEFRYILAKDKVTVYAADGKTVLGNAVAIKDGSIIVTLKKQLSETDGEIFVTVKNDNKVPCNPVSKSYNPQAVTTNPLAANIIVTNNVDFADTVTVYGLTAKDKVMVYAADGKTMLGTATTYKGGTIVVTLKKQLSENDLELYVTVKNDNKVASDTVLKTYNAQAISSSPAIASITVVNNVDITDTVTIASVLAKDTVTVYAIDEKTVLGTAVATKNGAITVTLKKQLSEYDGEIYVTVKSYNKMPCDKIVRTYSQQAVSADPIAVVVNNSSKADTVTVVNAVAKDKITVYAVDGKTVLGSTVAVTSGPIVVTLKTQLSETDLELLVTLKSYNKMISEPRAVTYTAQK